jgi:putative peptidoglycan lipid II flippase
MGPTFIPLSMMQLSEQATKIAAMALSSTDAHSSLPLAAGIVQCQYAAGRLYQFPMGVLGVSLSTAVFPLLARYVARGDEQGLRQTITRALRLCFFLGIPTGAGLVALARPIVEAIFLRGKFTGGADPLSDGSRTPLILQMYCMGMPAYFVVHVLLRAFFARKETRGPMIVSSVLGVATVALTVAGFFTPLRHASMGLVTAVVFIVNAAIFGWMIQRRVGRLDWRAIFISAVRVSAATAAMVAATLASLWWVQSRTFGKLPTLVVPMAAGAAVFAAAAFVLRCPELTELRRRKQPATPVEEKKTE